MDALKEKYEKNLQELDRNIPMLQQLVAKPFERENELAQLKKDVSNLELEISIKIQENQMKQRNVADENNRETKEIPVVKIAKSLLPKKEITKKSKGMGV